MFMTVVCIPLTDISLVISNASPSCTEYAVLLALNSRKLAVTIICLSRHEFFVAMCHSTKTGDHQADRTDNCSCYERRLRHVLVRIFCQDQLLDSEIVQSSQASSCGCLTVTLNSDTLRLPALQPRGGLVPVFSPHFIHPIQSYQLIA